jgi:hypothetical protein
MKHHGRWPGLGADMTRYFVNAVMRPLIRLWLQFSVNSWWRLPLPPDSPVLHCRGIDPARVLFTGGGIAAGYGVLSHELGFVGQLARRLAVLSGRAIDIQVSAGMTARVCTQQLASTSLSRFDAIVLVIGSVEALELRSTRSGRKDIAGLLDTAREYAPPKTEIFILSIPIVGEATGFPAVLTSLVAHQSRQCSAITADLAAAVPHTSVIAIDQVEALSFPGTASGERWASIAQTSSTCRWRLSPSLTKTGSG